MSGMVVLVTGAAGRIGSAMVARLRELGIERRCVDLAQPRTPPQEPWLVRDLGDSASAGELREFCRPVTHAIHLASRVTNAKDLEETYSSQFRIEVLGSQKLLRALPSSTRHVSYASSMTVYGAPEYLPVGEDHPLRPACVYALCKVAVERELAAFSRERGIPAAALRISSVYGPGAPDRRAIGAMIERALSGRPIEVFGDGTVRRDYIYVEDVCRAALSVAVAALDGPVNVGTGRGTSASELAEVISRLAGSAASPVLVPRELDEQASASMIFDIRRLSRAAHFAPQVSLEEGLSRIIAGLRGSHCGTEAIR
ncbi:MAG: NAD-dependent epimerase/dehydratase family protein [Elusimicrobia bacterium]|nr:NAD-dependent epimerase/dehydratase family protein [Elusimicrobiota bacterium]